MTQQLLIGAGAVAVGAWLINRSFNVACEPILGLGENLSKFACVTSDPTSIILSLLGSALILGGAKKFLEGF